MYSFVLLFCWKKSNTAKDRATHLSIIIRKFHFRLKFLEHIKERYRTKRNKLYTNNKELNKQRHTFDHIVQYHTSLPFPSKLLIMILSLST